MRHRRHRLGLGLALTILIGVAGPERGRGDVSPTTGEEDVLIERGDLQQLVAAAEPGATLLLRRGQYQGPVTIETPVTIRGEPGTVISGDGRGSVIEIVADDVRLERLIIRRSGRDLSKDDAGILVLGDRAVLKDLVLRENLHGVYLLSAEEARLSGLEIIGLAATEEEPEVIGADAVDSDHMHHSPPTTQSLMGNGIHLFDADGATVEGNYIHHVRDGIYVAHTNRARIERNRIHDSRYGIHYMYSSDNLIADNELWGNVAGPALMFSRNLEVRKNSMYDHSGFRAYGLLLQNVDASRFTANEIRANRVGMRLQNSSANEFRRNRLTGNLLGMTMNNSSRDNLLTRNEFGVNLRQIGLTGPVPPTDWAEDGVGNEWSDALPLDLTGDGVSEWPHHEVDLLAERRERFPEVELLVGSMGIKIVEWALRKAPIPGMRYITDPHPLVNHRVKERG